MGVSLIIPTKNRNKIILKTISTALEILPKITSNYEIIVINDGEEDVFFYQTEVKVYKNKGNGVASARNYGVTKSKYENLLFLDDDILLTTDALKYYLSFFEDNDKSKKFCLNIHWTFNDELMAICRKNNFGRYLIKIGYTDMKGWMKGCDWADNSEFVTPNLASYALAITKENFDNVSGYNEKYPFAGFEDYDFSQRINKSGIKVLLNTQFLLFHNEEDRISPQSWFRRRYREGATRAVYVKLISDEKYKINHNIVKRIVYKMIYKIDILLLFKTKLLNIKAFDFLTFKIFKALEGAYIWKGYTEYAEKN